MDKSLFLFLERQIYHCSSKFILMYWNSYIGIGFDERRGRGDRGNANLDPKHELDVPANREFYKHNDVRPPYTYAALIRYVSLVYF